MKQTFQKTFHLLFKNPVGFYYLIKALLKGCCYIVYYGLARKCVRIEFPFFAYAPLGIYGDGTVHIHKNCSSRWNVFKGLTIVTLSPESEVVIGEGCDLGGTTIRCETRIVIGNRALTAQCLIQDALLVNRDRLGSAANGNDRIAAQPITIGDDTWLGGNTCVLSACSISDGCVLSQGAVLLDAHVPPYHLAAGNPSTRKINISALRGFVNR
jgi:acetyltransferase-like isoleucine patch superfamily enzyme